MRAIGLRHHGGPEALEEIELPVEPLNPGQVRIRASAAAVSPSDTLPRAGAYTDSPDADNIAHVPVPNSPGRLSRSGPTPAPIWHPGTE